MSAEPGRALATIEDKVAFLRDPRAYSEPTERVDVIDTHMSWVFLTERHAYKLKKPVRYDFLDFSSVEARRWHCEEEVRLNRKLAADVYLGTVSLHFTPAGGLSLDGEGEIVDWLVKMRRLPEALMLDHALRSRTVGEDEIRAFTSVLARFHREAEPTSWKPEAYRRHLEKNTRESLDALTDEPWGLNPGRIWRIHEAQLRTLEVRPELFEERAHAGRIVEGHGDLRPDHICLTEHPVIIDCLEFKREFRIIDTADELAFLAMECEMLDAPYVGRIMFPAHAELTGDAVPETVFDYYKSCRATLRAKLAIWHVKDPTVTEPDRWPHVASRYLEKAEEYAEKLP